MTDLDHDTWMLSGSSVLQDGVTIQNGYACDLDKLREGDRLGIMRKPDSTLHFFVNGQDCGIAASSVPSGNTIFSSCICVQKCPMVKALIVLKQGSQTVNRDVDLFFTVLGIYAIIDLYGRCVELAVYDEDFTRRPARVDQSTSTETQTTCAATTTTENEGDQSKSGKTK